MSASIPQSERKAMANYEAVKERWAAAGAKPISEDYTPPPPKPRPVKRTAIPPAARVVLPADLPRRPSVDTPIHTIPVKIRREIVRYSEHGRDADQISLMFDLPVEVVRRVLLVAGQ